MTAASWHEHGRHRPLVIGNWKMNGNVAMLGAIDAIARTAASAHGARVCLAVPHTMIAAAATGTHHLLIGAQDVHAAAEGAYTGSVSARLVREAGARFTIIGHSERRTACGEDEPALRAKIDCAVDAELAVLLCCGESTAVRMAGRTVDHALHQLAGAVAPQLDLGKLAIAYEPCWAIGTSETPSLVEVAAVVAGVKDWLRGAFGKAGDAVPVLYGGAVDASFAGALMCETSSDGVLLGRASLDCTAMSLIIERLSANWHAPEAHAVL